jgi:hypothetical protein
MKKVEKEPIPPGIQRASLNSVRIPLLNFGAILLTIAIGSLVEGFGSPAGDIAMLLAMIPLYLFPLSLVVGFSLGIYTLFRLGLSGSNGKEGRRATHAVLGNGFILFLILLAWLKPEMIFPGYTDLRSKAYKASARSAGRNAKLAEEIYFDENKRYTGSLDELLAIDRNLIDDPGVTFDFTAADEYGFAFTVTHAKDREKAVIEYTGESLHFGEATHE